MRKFPSKKNSVTHKHELDFPYIRRFNCSKYNLRVDFFEDTVEVRTFNAHD